MFWVYLLECADGSFYTGHTDDLERRFFEHQHPQDSVCYTASRLPVTLVYQREFTSRYEALTVERQIKGWSRKKKIALIAGDWGLVSILSKNRQV